MHSIFGAEITTAIFKLHDQAIEKSSEAEERSCARKSKNLKPVHSAPISEKQVRTDAHQAIRRIFNSSLETTTDSCGVVILTAATRSQRRQQNRQANNPSRNHEGLGKLMWEQLGGEYLHFTLYKENKDTMEVLSYLASQLRINHKRFQFAGTKDRRAVTVQRMSVYRVKKEALIIAGRKLRNAQLSSFEYYQAGLELGQLLGNEFVITLRDCRFEDEGSLAPDLRVKYVQDALSKAVSNIRQNGFINYYGLQRFGTFSVSTDTIGTKILKGDYKGAVADILSPTVAATATRISDGNRSISWEDKARAEALEIWHTTHNATETLQKMPRKFSAELGIIRYLGYVDRKSGQRSQQSDFRGALQTIPRNLRLMYLHAYQSLVWNNVASFRWRQYGSRVVPGDLVLLNEHGKLGKDEDSARRQSVAEVADVADVAEGNIHSSEDQFGEVVVDPASTDSSIVADAAFLRARPLSKVEVDSSKYNILDIVLPLPGFDVIYPDNDVGKYYETLMSSSEGGAMDPHSMKRGWREASLSGGYRKFIAKPDADISATFERHQSNEKLVETDVDRLEQSKRNITISTLSSNAPLKIEQGDKVAVILRMQLSASQYATVALRELMKSDGVIAFQPSH